MKTRTVKDWTQSMIDSAASHIAMEYPLNHISLLEIEAGVERTLERYDATDPAPYAEVCDETAMYLHFTSRRRELLLQEFDGAPEPCSRCKTTLRLRKKAKTNGRGDVEVLVERDWKKTTARLGHWERDPNTKRILKVMTIYCPPCFEIVAEQANEAIRSMGC